MFQIGHPGGLCNRLDVITTGYLLARERGERNLEVIWPVNNQMPVGFHDLFTDLPRGRLIEETIDLRALEMVQAQYWAAWASLPSNYQDSAFYGEMLRGLLAKVVPQVQAEVSAFTDEHFRNASRPVASTVGVHIRRLEPSVVVQELYPGTSRRRSACKSPDLAARQLCEFAQPLRYYEAAMRSFPCETRFFISTDSQEAFRWLHARFGGRVFQRPKVQDDRNSLTGVREGLVDILLLSRCYAIVGTWRSSFSHLAALAGGLPYLRVKTFPVIPVGWPSFSRWRWLWAYRHFLVESTFWRRWSYYDVRPHVERLPRIPAKLMRVLRHGASRSNHQTQTPTVADRASSND